MRRRCNRESIVIRSESYGYDKKVFVGEDVFGEVVGFRIPKAFGRHLDAFTALLPDHHLDDELVPTVGELLQTRLNVLAHLRRPSI